MTYHYSATYAVPQADWHECKVKTYHLRSCDWDCPHCGAQHIFGVHSCHADCDHPVPAIYEGLERLNPNVPFPAPALEFGQIDKGENRLDLVLFGTRAGMRRVSVLKESHGEA